MLLLLETTNVLIPARVRDQRTSVLFHRND